MSTLNNSDLLILQIFFPMKDTQFEELQDDDILRVCSACMIKKPTCWSKLAGTPGYLLFYCEECKKEAKSRMN